MIALPNTIITPEGQSVDKTGPEQISVLLDLYFDALEEIGAPVRAHAAPGLPASLVRDQLREVGLSAPEELVAWFGKFNGLQFEPDEPVFGFPNFALHSLEEAIRLYKDEANILGYGDEAWQWNPEWLRIGDPVHSLAVKCDPKEPKTVLVRSVGDDRNTQEVNPTYQVVSLCTPLTWWVEGLRLGLYQWNLETRRWVLTDRRLFPVERAISGLV